MNVDRINERYYGDLADAATERARARIHWMCSQAAGREILDIGCSQGIVCLILGREGFRCVGIDLEAGSLAVGERALAEEDKIIQQRVTFQVADASQLPFEAESFDTVMLGEVLEHLAHPAKVLSEAKRVLREGGRLVVTVPHGLNAFHDHKCTYYPISLLNLLRPLFRTQSIDILNSYITYTGAKDRAYQPTGIPSEEWLEECLRWELMLEDRCLEKERALLEMGTKLYAQVKSLTAQSTEQADRIKELEELAAAKDSSIRNLEDSVTQACASVASLREGVKEAEALQVRLSSEAASSRAALAAVEQRVATLQSEDAELRREVLAKEAQLAGLRAELANACAAVGAAERERTTMQTEIASLRKELARREDERVRLLAEASNFNAALTAGERRRATLEAELVTLRKEGEAANAAWQQRVAQVEMMHAARLREMEGQLRDLAGKQKSESNRRVANQRIRDVVRSILPAHARVLVISKGDDELVLLDGRHGSHFPQAAGGVYAGYHPADSAEAVAHLETLRANGAEFLLIPASSFWWLDYYADFRRHLESQYRLLAYNEDTCVIFALSGPSADPKGRLAVSLERPSGTNQAAPAQAKPTETRPAPTPVRVPPPAATSTPVAEPGRMDSSAAPAVQTESQHPPKPVRLALGGVLDEFTAACFGPDCTLVTFRPDNWKAVLERTPIDLLFVESAWQGNGGSWQYKIASFKKPMGDEIVDVVKYCRERKIPTVFWNKEDPPHFDRFIHRAPLFDVVFTSDADMIPKYREVVKHDRVFALPFAAQPRIHNPILDTDRMHNVCFAGAYYGMDHDERRADMDVLLRPALAFGLHIYDRQHGIAGANAQAYRFPDIYQSAIKGRLEYGDMVRAYKWYKVFMNVNSVKRSPTMFSRRVFELLASGTPVVSSYAKAIVELLGKDIVHLSRSEDETRSHLERLLSDETYWSQISVKGIREIFGRHTYAHRLAEVCRNIGLPFPGTPQPAIMAVARIDSDAQIQRVSGILARQTYRNFSLAVIAGKAVTRGRVEAIRGAVPDIQVRVLPSGTDCLEPLSQAANGTYLWLLSLDDFYGDNFLTDAANTVVYAGPDIIGKHTHYAWDSGRPNLQLKRPGSEFRWVNKFSPGSVIAKAGKLEVEHWRALAANREIVVPNLRGLSIDRYNYVRHGGGVTTLRSKSAHSLFAKALL